MEYTGLLDTELLLHQSPGRARVRCSMSYVALVLGLVLLSSLLPSARSGAAPPPLASQQVTEPPPAAVNTEMRTVRMIAFDFAGKPAAGAAVSAIYTWENMVVRKEAVADTDGSVTWTAVPHVRIIVWGDRVPAGVLGPDETAVTTPLPPPVEMTPEKPKPVVPGNPANGVRPELAQPPDDSEKKAVRAQPEPFNFRWSNPTEQEANFIVTNGFVTMGSGVKPIFGSPSPRCSARCPDRAITGLELTPGCPTGLFFCATTTPLEATRIEHVYVPYPDGCRHPWSGSGVYSGLIPLSGHLPPEWPVTLTPCPQVCLRFRTQDGQPIPGVNRLELAAGGPGSLVLPAVSNFPYNLFPASVSEQGDGSYLLTTLTPGKYRLLVDLYDATAPSPEALILDIQPGAHEQTVTLPEPLIRVPSGSMLHWITPNAPATARSLLATAYASPMPVFGPREGLLAWWYHPTPDTLEIHQSGKPVLHLTQHAVTLETPAQPTGQPQLDNTYGLYPLLPFSPPFYSISPQPAHGMSESDYTWLPCGKRRVIDLWDAPYAYCIGNNEPGNCLLATLPPTEHPGAAQKMQPLPAGPAPPCMRGLYLERAERRLPATQVTGREVHPGIF